jgi:hypothetical protein
MPLLSQLSFFSKDFSLLIEALKLLITPQGQGDQYNILVRRLLVLE